MAPVVDVDAVDAVGMLKVVIRVRRVREMRWRTWAAAQLIGLAAWVSPMTFEIETEE